MVALLKRAMKTSLAAFLLLLSAAGLRAEDWKTTDGKTYTGVKVMHADAESVTILHHDGGARVLLAKLPADLQQRFHYDPEKAKSMAANEARTDAANRHRLQAEMNLAARKRSAQYAADQAAATSAVALSQSDTQPGTDQVVVIPDIDRTPRMGADPDDSTHHSIDELAQSASFMRRDLSDPTYHTTAHMVYVIRQEGLGPDLSDPKHHTIQEISGH